MREKKCLGCGATGYFRMIEDKYPYCNYCIREMEGPLGPSDEWIRRLGSGR